MGAFIPTIALTDHEGCHTELLKPSADYASNRSLLEFALNNEVKCFTGFHLDRSLPHSATLCR